MNDMKNIAKKAEITGLRTVSFISKHRTVILVFVASIAVLMAVMQAQSYLNPARNELKYTEIKSSTTIRKIDEDVLRKLEKTQEDIDNTVDGNLVIDRKNPFSE